ncbi:sugar transferase [Levilactobacillus yiduensis]|uniref:sugar transferase n=1 Tax=Levilactobacillus yiduensis TaxID=2953880 RepID=UPI000EF33A53|nr:sugar transferase [Levilactobacillus yiduensis]AYM02785.1 sugar transferase [Levilactobacillus brevis]
MEYRESKIKSPSIDVVYQQHRYIYRFCKRLFDIMASLIAVIILSPLFLIVALLIKLDDGKGPVIYSQIRLGKYQRPFRMYKFRSMIVGADKKKAKLIAQNDVAGAMFKMKEDPRITRLGHYLRKYSIDELPQLVNVLLGQMSLVGPRPPLPREVAEYTPFDKQRLAVKPGCTGLWQVTLRNDASFEQMVRLDLKYIEKRGFWFDLYMLVRTVAVFVKPNGAY